MTQAGLQPELIKRESLNSTEIEKILRIFPFGINLIEETDIVPSGLASADNCRRWQKVGAQLK